MCLLFANATQWHTIRPMREWRSSLRGGAFTPCRSERPFPNGRQLRSTRYRQSAQRPLSSTSVTPDKTVGRLPFGAVN